MVGQTKRPFHFVNEAMDKCVGVGQKAPERKPAPNNRIKMAYSGFCNTDLIVTQEKCAWLRESTAGEVEKEAVGEMISSLDSGNGKAPRTILLKHLNAIGLRPKKKAKQLLLPLESFDKIAKQFVKRTLGQTSFLGAHIRRNEFVKVHPESTPSAVAAAARINSAIKKHSIDQVFVHTDALHAYREELRRLVRAPLYYFAPDDGAPTLDRGGHEEVVCQRILKEARIFIGTENSAFSRILRRERRNSGMSKESTQVFCANLTVKGADRPCY